MESMTLERATAAAPSGIHEEERVSKGAGLPMRGLSASTTTPLHGPRG